MFIFYYAQTLNEFSCFFWLATNSELINICGFCLLNSKICISFIAICPLQEDVHQCIVYDIEMRNEAKTERKWSDSKLQNCLWLFNITCTSVFLLIKKRKVAFPSLFDKHKRNVFAEVCMSLRWVWEGVRKKAIGRISLSAGWQGNNAKNLIQIKLGIQLRIKLLFFFQIEKRKELQ